MEKIKELFNKLPFRGLAEKIPAGARAKVPLLETIVIPYANQIVCGIVALVILTACFGGGGGGKSAYYGTWQSHSGQLEISANKITWRHLSGDSYETRENLTWLPVDNTDRTQAVNYPKGFEVTGTYTAATTESNIGRTVRTLIFLHNNKSSIMYRGTTEYRKQ